jgi:hypothetical protein
MITKCFKCKKEIETNDEDVIKETSAATGKSIYYCDLSCRIKSTFKTIEHPTGKVDD